MSDNRLVFEFSGNSPDASSTAAVGSICRGLLRYRFFTIHANLVGATGGTLNVRLQRKITDDVWSDWVSFPQLADAASAISYALDIPTTSEISAVGGGTDASPTVALAADSTIGGHPGPEVRMVCTAGAGTSAGAAVSVYLVGWTGLT